VAAIIEVENVTKWYGRTLALDRVSFTVEKGQIVGFLGPNGAGKSTTLRILTGYLPATTGSASVAGHDVLLESLAVRSSIGYMPENVPLYPEMRVDEYLRFRAGLKGSPRRERGRAADRVIERCWLKDVRRRLIGQLSKGFRQRVGLAEALVSDPPVLILDEPTIGLDPTQIQEVRRLIRSLGGQHTVVLSSHILPEVEKTCSHLVIISSGRIAAAGSVEGLKTGHAQRHKVILEVRTGKTAHTGPMADGPAEMVRVMRLAPGVAGVAREEAGDGWTRLTVTAAADTDPRESLFAVVAQRGWLLREMRLQVPTLEELWVQVTSGDAAARTGSGDKSAA
jgi:ABC-2 type transport system ATP-binding protein